MSSKNINIVCQCIILATVISSCVQNSTEKIMYNDFPVKDSIYGRSLVGADSLPVCVPMFSTGEWLVTHQWQNKKRPFHFYRLGDLEDSFDAGFIGHGNNEFTFIDYSAFFPMPDGSFYLLDNDRLKCVALQEDRSLQTVSVQKTFSQIPVNGFVLCGEDKCVSFADCAMGTTGDLEYRILDLSSGQEKKFSPYPFFHRGNLDQDELCQLYHKKLFSNANTRKLMAFYSRFPYIRLYDGFTKLTKEVQIGERETVTDPSQAKMYFGNCYSTADYVIVKSPIGLQVWSWEAEPLALLYPDNDIAFFCVNSSKGLLYAQVYDKEYDCYRLYSYVLPSLM